MLNNISDSYLINNVKITSFVKSATFINSKTKKQENLTS